jgi:hypothetical protein
MTVTFLSAMACLEVGDADVRELGGEGGGGDEREGECDEFLHSGVRWFGLLSLADELTPHGGNASGRDQTYNAGDYSDVRRR